MARLRHSCGKECLQGGTWGALPENAGWYGSTGKVEDTWFLQTDNGVLFEYDPERKMKFVDIEKEYRENMEENIKSKLTKEELEFLNLK